MSSDEPTYPVFVQAPDDLTEVCMFASYEEFQYHYEQNDIELEPYKGWDSYGYPLRLEWLGREGGQIVMTGEGARPDELRQAILLRTHSEARHPAFAYEGPPEDVVALFCSVEKWYLETSPPRVGLVARVARWLKGAATDE